MTSKTEFDPIFQLTLPLPLARLYARAHHAKGDRERHDQAFHLVEATLKLAASALVARYRTSGRRSPKVDAALRSLALPSLGQWRAIFRELLAFLGRGLEEDSWAREILDRLAAVPEDGSLADAFGAMASAAQYAGRVSARVSPFDLLDLLPTYRNAMSDAHGGVKVDPKAYRESLPALLALVRALFEGGAVLGGGKLVYAEEVRVGTQGEERVVWMDLTGPTAMRRQPYDGVATEETILPARLYLEIAGGGHLALHPLLHYQPGDILDQVYFLNRARTGTQGIQFLCYATGDFYMPGRDELGDYLVNDLRDLLSWVVQEKVDGSHLEKIAAESASDAGVPSGAAAISEPEPAGTVLGDYEILGELGRGGMAVVYLARQRSLARQVALKVLPPVLRGDPVALARFRQEVKALARCDHPNVVKILSSGEAGGTDYYAMEYIEGGDLGDIRRTLERYQSSGAIQLREGHFDLAASSSSKHPGADRMAGLPEAEPLEREPIEGIAGGRNIAFRLAAVMRDTARGVHHIHEHGIVHRDLKPQNIMVTRDEHRPVVMDLGLAKLSEVTRSLTMDRGSVLGTLRYMPPEQLQRNLLDVDARADVYALGAVLYELVCLHPMMDGDTEERLTAQILFEDPPPAQKVNPRLPTDLATIIAKATRKDPRERYGSAAELADDLDRFVHGEAISAKPPTLGYLVRVFLGRHRTTAIAATIALVAFAGIIAGWMVSLRSAWKGERAARETAQESLVKEEASRRLAEEALRDREGALREKDAALLERTEALQRSEGLRLVAQSSAVLPRNPGLAFLLAIEGTEREPGVLASAALLEAMEHLREERTFPANYGYALHAAYSPDGRKIVASYYDRTARIWDAGTGEEVISFPHEKFVLMAEFLPEGGRVVTACYDGTARIWDAATGRELFVLRGHASGSIGMRISRDGHRLLTYSRDGSARIWDLSCGKDIAWLSGHTGAVLDAQFSPDGRRALTASYDKTARVWDTESGKGIAVLSGHEKGVYSAAFSPDGLRAATASDDKTARIWDAGSGKELARLAEPVGTVDHVVFSPEGARVATASSDGTVRIWDSSSGKEVAVLKGHGAYVSSLTFSPDGHLILSASGDGTARIWDAASGKEIASLAGQGQYLYSAKFSPDGERVLTASADGTVRLWRTQGSASVRTLRGHEARVNSLAFSPDGLRLVTGSADGTARTWDPATGKGLLGLTGHGASVDQVAWSPDGRRIVTASADKTARVWDASTGKGLFVLEGHTADVSFASFAPDGKSIVTASSDQMARLWDASDGKPLAKLIGHQGGLYIARFRPDGSAVVTASWDKTARLWDAASGKQIARMEHTDYVNSAAFSPDGRRVVTASDDGTARIWDAGTGERVLVLEGHASSVLAASFSPDGSRVVTALYDKTARVWDAASGKEVLVLRGHLDSVADAVFSPDGRTILTTSRDGTARIWDATNGRALAAQTAHVGPVNAAAFAPDGRSVASASFDSSVRLWPVDPLSVAKSLRPRTLSPDERDMFQVGTSEERREHRKAWNLERARRSLVQARRAWTANPEQPEARLGYVESLNSLAGAICAEVLRKPLFAVLAQASPGVSGDDPRGTELLGFIQEIRARRVEIEKAILVLEERADDPDARSGLRLQLRDLRRLFLPDLPTYASIDDAIEDTEAVIEEGAEWRFFRGRKEPSPGPEWTAPEFDDGVWEKGPSGFGSATGARVTGLDDIQGSYTSLYLRRAFDLEDAGPSVKLVLSVLADDGCVAYLNGAEVGRARAGDPGTRVPFDGTASVDWHSVPDRFPIDPGFLRKGRNVLAVQGLNCSKESGFLLVPVLGREAAPGSERDSRRFDGCRAAVRGSEASGRLAYLEGRLLQRAGKGVEAQARFEEASRLDRERPEPVFRIAEILRALGRPAEAESQIREFIRAGGKAGRKLRDLWYLLSALDLKRSPAELLAALPESLSASTPGEDLRWAFERLLGEGALRINCGDLEYTSPRGVVWGKDRFFLSGHPYGRDDFSVASAYSDSIDATEDDRIYQTERWFDDPDPEVACYRIPVPPGRYRVVLDFAEVVYKDLGKRIFDVFLDGNKILDRYEPRQAGFATAEAKSFEVEVADAFLDIGFGHIKDRPKISGIEVLIPDFVDYRAVDLALDEPEAVIPEGAEWQFFRGKKEPSIGLEWTAPEFDDSAWEKGPSGFGYGDDDDATVLDDMRAGYTSVYVRRAFDVADPAAFTRIVLAVRVDDGFVAYLNGIDLGRYLAGEPGTRIAFDGTAATTAPEPAPTRRLAIDPMLLRRGRNVVALHGLNSALDSSDLTLDPVLLDEVPGKAGRDEGRIEKLRAAAAKDPSGRGLLYLEGRLHHRADRLAEARSKFEDLLRRDPLRQEPLVRLAEVLRASGDPAGAESRLRQYLSGGLLAGNPVWDLWFVVSAVDLKRDPAAILASFPPAADPSGRGADLRWALESLKAAGAIRINCGGAEYRDRSGALWGRDRFFRSGHDYAEGIGEPGRTYPGAVDGTEDDPLYQTERWFPSPASDLPGYSIPLPPGAYRVTLHFAELYYQVAERRAFGVVLEGAKVLEGYEPIKAGFATADRKTFETTVSDGILDIDFLHERDSPKISAIEVLRQASGR